MLTKETALQIAKKNKEPLWFAEQRIRACETFTRLPMPTFKYGLGIFLNPQLSHLEDIRPLESLDERKIVVPEGIELVPLAHALHHHAFLKDIFARQDSTKLAALHRAFSPSGWLIRIPKGWNTPIPLRLDLLMASSTIMETIVIVAEEGSRAVVVDSLQGHLERGYHSHTVHLAVHDDAVLDYFSVQSLPYGVTYIAEKKAILGKRAALRWVDCQIGAGFSSSLNAMDFTGEGSSGTHYGLYLGHQEQCFDLQTQALHTAPSTKSRLLTHGVLGGSSKAVHRGLIRIMPGCSGCDGYQQQHTLLLSEHAEVDPVPTLEIHNDDVRCSHGTTISDVDEEKLFYLMSRGLDKEAARKSVVEGFLSKILDEMRDPLRERAREQIILQAGRM